LGFLLARLTVAGVFFATGTGAHTDENSDREATK
jgi:hypothetical protein